MQQLTYFKYNFIYLCNLLRFLQIFFSILDMILIFLESGNLSYLWFVVYMSICGLFLHHVLRKFVFNIDGRYDVQRLFAETHATTTVQYAIASLSACLLSWPMWYVVQLKNGYGQVASYICGAVCVTAAHLLLALEVFEIAITKIK